MAAAKKGLWGWVQDVGKTCGFTQPPQQSPMWVRATPDLFPQQVPGMGDELLAEVSAEGGSLEEKVQAVIDAFRCGARHLESLQQVLRKRALERRSAEGVEPLPDQVEDVIAAGSYAESFLEAFDGQSFLLYREEIVPAHEYRLALEVHTGGAYWSSIPVQDGAVRHKVETVGASSPAEGSATIISHFGAGQRGAVFVWRWQQVLEQGPYNLPEWLAKALSAEGNDPLRKLQGELEAIRRWKQQARHETAQHVKAGVEIKDPYIREVLRLWPSDNDPQGEQLKKCAWIEGLDSRLFVGRTVLVHRIPYDSGHALALHATISKRQCEEPAQESNPPYRLTTAWSWAAAASGAAPGSAAGLPSRQGGLPAPGPPEVPLTSSSGVAAGDPSRPSTAASEVTRPGSAYSQLTRPGTAYSEATRPGSSASGTGGLPQPLGPHPVR